MYRAGKSAVRKLVARAAEVGLEWERIAPLPEESLAALLYPAGDEPAEASAVVPDWNEVARELRRKGVTKRLLWEEYGATHKGQAYSYSRYCEPYVAWKGGIEPGAAGDQEGEAFAARVELTLEPALPAAPLVQLVKDDEGLARRPARGAHSGAVLAVVPREVGPGAPPAQHVLGERGLADLARSGKKDHLLAEIIVDRRLAIAFRVHGRMTHERKKSCNYICG